MSPLVFLLNFKGTLLSLLKSKPSIRSKYPSSDDDDADWLERVILRFRPLPGPVRTLLKGPFDTVFCFFNLFLGRPIGLA
jgi:hypothetical protein